MDIVRIIGLSHVEGKASGLIDGLKEWQDGLRPGDSIVISPISLQMSADSCIVGFVEILTPRNFPQRAINALPKCLKFDEVRGIVTYLQPKTEAKTSTKPKTKAKKA